MATQAVLLSPVVAGCSARPAPKQSPAAIACGSNPRLRLQLGAARPQAPRYHMMEAARFVMATTEETEIDVEEDAMDKMDKTVESVKRNFGTVRTGRANPAMLDRVDVDYYGAMTPLKQIAGVSTPEATLLVVQPYDTSAIPAIERAIMASDIGLTPNNDGRIIRLSVPQLTSERRKEMTKIVAKLSEEGKVAVRNVRRDAMKTIEKLEKDGAVSEDGRKGLEDAVQKLTDEYVKQIDALAKSKNDELSKV